MPADTTTTTPRPSPRGPLDRSAARHALGELVRQRAASFVATLHFLDGEAEVADAATGRSRRAEAGVRLGRDTRLAILSGRALVRLDDGSDVWLADGATLDFSGWSEAVRGLRLAAGRALALVARCAARPFVTATALGEVRVTGTAFEADARGAALEVAVLHGSVEVATPFGRARAAEGRTVTASAAAAPTVARLVRPAERCAWLGDLSASAANAAIAPAFRAVARTTHLSPIPTRGTLTMNRSTMSGVVALLVAAGAGAWYFTSTPAPSPSAPAPAVATASSPSGGAAPDAGQPGARSFTLPDGRTVHMAPRSGEGGAMNWEAAVPRRVMKLKIGDQEYSFDPGDDASFEAALAQAPEDVREKLRGIREKVRAAGPGDLGGGLPGISDEMQAAIQQDAESSREAVRKLIESGVAPDEAARIVSQSLQESLQARLKASGSDAKVYSQVGASADGGEQKMQMMLMVTDDEDTPPAADAPAGQPAGTTGATTP